MRNLLLGSISGLAMVVGISGPSSAVTWYDYTVKFVCGTSEDAVVYADYAKYVPVHPGTYYTAINIHDPNYHDLFQESKVKPEIYATAYVMFPYHSDLSYNEGDEFKPQVDDGESGYTIWAYFDFFRAFELDCGHIYGQKDGFFEGTYYEYGQKFGLIKGVVSIFSKYPLDITAVYTASTGEDGAQVSIDVEQITGRKYNSTSGKALGLGQ